MATQTPSHAKPQSVLRGVVRAGWKKYVSQWQKLLLASLPPILLIAALRWLSDDQTGAQYDIIIAGLSLFTTMLIVRLAVAGWDRKKVTLIAYYNGVMLRFISAIGLSAVYTVLSVPALGGLVVSGLALTKDLPVWVLIISLPLALIGVLLMAGGSLALFAMLDDMSLTVMQAYRVSFKLTRQFWRPVVKLLALAGFVLVMLGAVIVILSQRTPLSLQDPQLQIWIDAAISWLITPIVLCLVAAVYQRLVEAYE